MEYCDDSPAKKSHKKRKKVNEPTKCIIHVVKIGTKECINRFLESKCTQKSPQNPLNLADCKSWYLYLRNQLKKTHYGLFQSIS